MPNLKPNDWTIADLVDLEYFFAQDTHVDEAALAGRDRELYRAGLAATDSTSRRDLLRRWLDRRRATARTDQSAPLPGDVAGPILRGLILLLFILGSMLGGGLAWGVLSYSGDRPINLFAAVALLVVLPSLGILFSIVVPGWRLARHANPAGILGGWLTGTLLTRLGILTYAMIGGKENARRAASLTENWGILRGRGGPYAGIMGWLAFGLMQFFSLCFSLAILITVLWRGWTSDLAFSWQTTTRLSAEQVYGVVAFIARPWAVLVDPPWAHPTIEQVVGSRVFLKEGLRHLASVDLQSWWTFLLWAILAYTVLPRLALLGSAFLGSHRAWRRLSFHDARCESLLRRMRQPRLKIGRESEPPADVATSVSTLPAEARSGMSSLRVLAPVELLNRPAADRLQTDVEVEFGASVEWVATVTLDEESDADLLLLLSGEPSHATVLLLLEGWQPCITATLEYLKVLRRRLGKERLLVVGLIGREDGERWGSPTPEHEFEIWRSRLAVLADPWLLVHNWGSSTHD